MTTTVMLPAEALTVIAPPPEMISQLNVEHVLGIPPRIFLELLREMGCPIEVTSVGKLRLVDRADFLCWLKARAKNKAAARSVEQAAGEDDAESVDDLLEFGLTPTKRPTAKRR